MSVSYPINVISSGDNHSIVGQITPEATMVVNFDNNLQGLTVSSVSNGVVAAAKSFGHGSVTEYEYHFRTFITESNATGFYWPTGTNCYKFGS